MIVLLALGLFLLAVLVVLIVTLLAGLGFLGLGWVFNHLFPLSQFEATLVALGTSALLIYLASHIVRAVIAMEEEEEEEEFEPPPIRRRKRPLPPDGRAGRR